MNDPQQSGVALRPKPLIRPLSYKNGNTIKITKSYVLGYWDMLDEA
jgi:hypothetical protein